MKFYFDFVSPYAYVAWTRGVFADAYLRGDDPVPALPDVPVSATRPRS